MRLLNCLQDFFGINIWNVYHYAIINYFKLISNLQIILFFLVQKSFQIVCKVTRDGDWHGYQTTKFQFIARSTVLKGQKGKTIS